MNIITASLFFPLSIWLLTIVRSSTLRFASEYANAAERVHTITDVSKLQRLLHDQLLYDQVQAGNVHGIAGSLGGLGCALILMAVINAFYLWKAHRALRP